LPQTIRETSSGTWQHRRKGRDFRGIMGQAKEEKARWELKDINFS